MLNRSNSEGEFRSTLSISHEAERTGGGGEAGGEEGSPAQPPSGSGGQDAPQTALIKALVSEKKPSLIDFWFTETQHTAASPSAC